MIHWPIEHVMPEMINDNWHVYLRLEERLAWRWDRPVTGIAGGYLVGHPKEQWEELEESAG